jgi:excinuclease ABC subunit C
MMREVLKRRFTSDEALPDLVVVDGGKGQLNIALSVLNELKIKLDVIGLAKEERGSWRVKNKTGGRAVGKEDRVYLPRRKDAVYLSSRPAALSLLQRVRDEAHRFAVSYHHRLKQKTDFRSILDAIPDIGNKRKKILLTHFGSASQVQKSTLESLQRIPGIGKELAEKIYSYFKKEQ